MLILDGFSYLVTKRDIIVTSIYIFMSFFGYLLNLKFRKRFIPLIFGFLLGMALLILTKFFFHLSLFWTFWGFISFIAGFLLAYINPIIYINIVVSSLIDVFTFSSHANQYTMLVSFIITLGIGFYSARILQYKSIGRFVGYMSIGLCLYYIISILFNPSIWLNGLLIGLLTLILGILIGSGKLKWVITPIIIIGLILFSFIFYPKIYIINPNKIIIAHQLNGFQFKAKSNVDSLFQKYKGVILLETWNQYCTSCFESMADLHPYFLEKEKSDSFRHYYVFVGNGVTQDSLYHFDYLPFDDQIVIIDSTQSYYKTLEMQGAPYFNFYKNGEFKFSISGYNEKYKNSYIRIFDKEINKLIVD